MPHKILITPEPLPASEEVKAHAESAGVGEIIHVPEGQEFPQRLVQWDITSYGIHVFQPPPAPEEA